jgi:hypothetical protein
VKMEAPGTSKNFIKLKSCTKPSDSPLGISLQDNKFFCWISNQFNARNNQKKCYKNIQTSSTNDFLLSSFIHLFIGSQFLFPFPALFRLKFCGKSNRINFYFFLLTYFESLKQFYFSLN